MKRRRAVMVRVLIGLGVSVLAAGALGGQPPESIAQDPLGVVARRGECVQFGSMSYVRGQTNGTADRSQQ